MGTELGKGGRSGVASGLRLFDAVLKLLYVLLICVTLVAVPLGYLALTGRGTLRLDAELDPPYTIELGDGRAVVNAGRGAGEWHNFAQGDEQRYLDQPPTASAQVRVDREDRDARAVLVVGVGAWLGLCWLGLVNLRSIVRAAVARRPFDARNVGRLRRLGGAVVAFPAVGVLMHRGLEVTLDVDPPVDLAGVGPGGWAYVVTGLGLVALAEVFREGARLRELEDATV